MTSLALHLTIKTFFLSQFCALHSTFKRIICTHGDYPAITETPHNVTKSAQINNMSQKFIYLVKTFLIINEENEGHMSLS